MKRIFTLCIACCITLINFAQDTTSKSESDTIHIGGMVIIRKAGSKGDTTQYNDNNNK